MFEFRGMWLPDGEKHFPDWCSKHGEIVDGRTTYQIKKWRACVPHIKNWISAIDVGSHVGFWSIQMAKRFVGINAFEPMPVFRECYCKNMGGEWDWIKHRGTVGPCSVRLWHRALGAKAGLVSMNYDPSDSGNTHVSTEQASDGVEMIALDDTGLPPEELGFIKIDCEGFEHHVIEGGADLIQAARPCIIVEQKQHKMAQNYPGQTGTPAVDLLKKMGATVREVISGDYILTFV